MMNLAANRKMITIAAILAACALPLVITDEYALRVLNVFFIYSVVALSINLIVGFCGQLDSGQGRFHGAWSLLVRHPCGPAAFSLLRGFFNRRDFRRACRGDPRLSLPKVLV